MAKLTLNDITGGYQTATAYNANNALIEAAFENTLSRDGSTPNQMGADLDMNSNDIANVADLDMTGTLDLSTGDIISSGSLNIGSLVLNGTVVTVINDAATVAAAPDATQVTYTPDGGSAGTLQDALDDDYIRNDENGILTGNLTVNGVLIGTNVKSNIFHMDGSRLNSDGFSTQITSEESWTGADWWMGRGLEPGTGGTNVPTYGITGDGVCLFSMKTANGDGEIHLSASSNDETVGEEVFGSDFRADFHLHGSKFGGSASFTFEGTDGLVISDALLQIPADSRLRIGTEYQLKQKVIEIGNWNMDSTGSVQVTHGLDIADIRKVTAFIRNDSDNFNQDFAMYDASATSDHVINVNTTVVWLFRGTDSFFDSASYTTVGGYNRGWITISYV